MPIYFSFIYQSVIEISEGSQGKSGKAFPPPGNASGNATRVAFAAERQQQGACQAPIAADKKRETFRPPFLPRPETHLTL
jgi:hypothetical protein